MMKTILFIFCLYGSVYAIFDRLGAESTEQFPKYPRCFLSYEYWCKKVFKHEKKFVKLYNKGDFDKIEKKFYTTDSVLLWRNKDYNRQEAGNATANFYKKTLEELAPGYDKLTASISSVRQLDEDTILVKGNFSLGSDEQTNRKVMGKWAHELRTDGKILKHMIKFSREGILF